MASFLTNLTKNRFTGRTMKSLSDLGDLNEDLNFHIKHYLVFPDEWILKLKILSFVEQNNYDKIKPIIFRALFDFYSETFLNKVDRTHREMFEKELKPFDRCMNYRYFEKLRNFCSQNVGKMEFTPIFKKELSFPHSKLKYILMLYRKYSTSPISKELLQLACYNANLYNKLLALKSDRAKWFETLTKLKDVRFIIQNIEYEISENPFDKDLWKLYLRYLKTVNKDATSQVYYRYRRLFLDDYSLEEEFADFQINDQTIYESDKGFLFEMKFYESTRNEQFDSDLAINISKEACTVSYLPPTQSQNFNIRSPLLQYLIQEAPPQIMFKLYKSCKFFFHLLKQPICYSLTLGEDLNNRYIKNSLALRNSTFAGLKNLWIQNSVFVRREANPLLLSAIIPKLGSCSIRYLTVLSDQTINTKQYKFLTQSQRIFSLKWLKGSIIDENENPIDLHKMLEPLSIATTVQIHIQTNIHPFNEQSVSSTNPAQPHIQKFELLLPTNLNNIGPDYFVNLLSKKMKNSSMAVLYFSPEFSHDFKKVFSTNFFDHWKNTEICTVKFKEKPVL